MALAAWMVVRASGWRAARLPLVLYGLQLLVNALWTWLFFAWRSGSAAVLDITVLWILVAAALWTFWRVRPLAGALLVPYLAWVSFAGALSWAVWRLNLGVL
jgi:tryptophan-rich sensory protein